MYNYYNYPIPEARQAWRSAYEIKVAALQHENRRVQMLNQDAAWGLAPVQATGSRKAGFLAFFQASSQILATLLG